MPPEALSKQLEDEGYALVPGVPEPEQVEELRSVLTRLFAEPSPYPGDIEHHGPVGCIRMDIFTRCPELRWLLVHEPLVRALREALGEDFVYLPEMSAHADGYGKWHKDTSSQERDGLLFHWTPDFRVVQVALYLQDNDSLGGYVYLRDHAYPTELMELAREHRVVLL